VIKSNYLCCFTKQKYQFRLRYFIELSYNGKHYHGWQNQPNAITVQEVIEDGLSKLLRTKMSIIGAGRTDAGVHAKQMFAHFDYEEKIDVDHLKFKLNSFLPKDVAIHKIVKVKEDAHARFDAVSRTYFYDINLEKDVFNFDNSYYLKHQLDIEKMKEAAQVLFQYKDFQCFSRSNTDVKTYNCKMMKAEWKLEGCNLRFCVQADRFLRNMVRAIVGTMIDIGLEKTTIDDFHKIIQSKDRTKAGASAPGHALYLVKVEYPNEIFLNE
jgi:tRNA pseudouridine38-40 synthase